MRIGLITFQNAENYGAALQCKALYTWLCSAGHDVEIINYRNAELEKEYGLLPRLRRNVFLLAEQYLYTLTHLPELRERKKRFDAFMADCKMTPPMTSAGIRKAVFPYDLVIAGSDQIWNPSITRGLDGIYFLQFGGHFRRAGYAISMGNTGYPQFKSDLFVQYIKSFDALSFREPDAAAFVGARLNRSFPQTADPTLLLTREQWDSVIGNMALPLPQKYIFVYYVFNGSSIQHMIKIAQHLSDQYGIPIVYLKMDRKLSNDFPCKVETLLDAGPREFLYLIKNAFHVVTSSFHATVLSCVYQKELSVVLEEERGSRIKAVAEMFHLEGRVYSSYEDFCAHAGEAKPQINCMTAEYRAVLDKSVGYLRQITRTGQNT